MGLGRGSLIPLGAAGFAGFVTWNLLVEWPGGDPGKALDAAEYYDSIGAEVKASLGDLAPMLDSVWRDNAGQGIDGFHAYLDNQVGPYVTHLTAYSEAVAEAYRDYAKALSTTQRTLIAMALTNFLQLMFAGMWSWTGVGSAAMAKALVDQMFRRIVAKTLIGELVKVLSEAVVRKLTGYVVGAAVYSVGNQTLSYLSDEALGVNPGTIGYNTKETFNNFVGCLPFWGLYDLTKLGPLAKVFPDNLVGNFGSFYVGSVSYTTVYNLLEGKSLDKSLPQGGQWLAKVGVYATQQSKPPAAGPAAPGTDPADPPATAPKAADPQPGGSQPNGAQPGGAQPGGAQPGGAQPAGPPAANPDPVNPPIVNPDPAGPPAANPAPGDPPLEPPLRPPL